jgi:GT2 family glycosyltransferase
MNPELLVCPIQPDISVGNGWDQEPADPRHPRTKLAAPKLIANGQRTFENSVAGKRALCDVSISVVAHNQRHDLARLLPSLQAAAARLASEILVVDYRSQDGSAAFLASGFPSVQVLRNDEPAGYGGNHNLNLARAKGKYFVVMNADLLVHTADLFLSLRDYMERQPDIGILGIKVLNEDGTIQGLNKRYPTLLDLALRRCLPRPFRPFFQQRLDYYEMRDIGYDQECDVGFVSGAFMFCRTEVLRALRGFDPRYFLYFEDVDLCRRVQRTHRTSYFPGASVTHYWHRDNHKSAFHTRWYLVSAARYFARWGVISH